MAYKDPEKRKEASRLSMEKKRKGLTSGINIIEGLTSKTGANAVIPEGVKLHRYIDGKRVEFKEVPEGFKVLSDGQLWSPEIEYTEPVKEEAVGHPILRYLVPGKKRAKMEAIVQSLKGHRIFELSDVFYGIGKNSIGMDTVGELLDTTGGK